MLDKVLNPTPHPQPAQQVVAPAAPDQMQAAIEAHLTDLNEMFDLEANPLTLEDTRALGRQPDESTWLKEATRLARQRAQEGTTVAGKKVTTAAAQPNAAGDIASIVRQEVAKAMGTGRPNTANSAGTTSGGATVESLNKIAADRTMSPRQRADALRKASEG